MSIKKGKDNMLTVDKINNLEYNNNLMNDTLSYIYEQLVDGYNHEMPWTAIDNCLKAIGKCNKEYKA